MLSKGRGPLSNGGLEKDRNRNFGNVMSSAGCCDQSVSLNLVHMHEVKARMFTAMHSGESVDAHQEPEVIDELAPHTPTIPLGRP